MSSEHLPVDEIAKHSALDKKNRRSHLSRIKESNYNNHVMAIQEAKWIQIFINGDEYFPGYRCVVNNRYYRNLDMLLTYLTERLQPSFGAVRNIYTPVNGHPVVNLGDLVSKQKYVAAGNERFKKLDFGYTDLAEKRNHRHRLKQKNKFKSTKTKYIHNSTLTINLYQNGNYKMQPLKLTLSSQDLENWESAYKKICEMLKCGPIKRVYSLSGKSLKNIGDLVNNQSYVAVGKHEVFKCGHYGNIASKNRSAKENHIYRPSQKSSVITHSSGVQSRLSAQSLRFNNSLSSRNSYRETSSSNSANTRLSDGESIQKSDCVDQYFSAYEDLMLKTNSAKHDFVTKLNLDLDAGGVFRSKLQNNQTIGAAEIEDGPETAVDLPIDLLDAEEIEDEITVDVERSLQHLKLDVPDEIVAFLPTMPKKSSDDSQQSSNKYDLSQSQNLDVPNIYV